MHGQVTDHILGGCTSVSLVHGAYLDKFRKCADAVTHFVVGVGSQLASMVGGALAAGAYVLAFPTLCVLLCGTNVAHGVVTDACVCSRQVHACQQVRHGAGRG